MSSTITAATASGQTETQLVTFLLGEEEFGFDIMNVQEIIRVPKVSRVPKTPTYVEGIANLRGIVLPIIDTRTRFGMEQVSETDRTRVLVIDNQGVRTGLRVDRVRQVTRVANSDIEQPPAIIKGVSADYLSGVVKLDQGKRIVMALNPAKVCQVQFQDGATTGEKAGPRTESAGSAATQQGTGDIEQMVTFKLGSEEFAFRIERIREILRVEEPKEVPDTPEYVLGVLTVRGQILPIVDLRRLLQQRSLAEELSGQFERRRQSYLATLESLRSVGSSTTTAWPDLAFFEAGRHELNSFTSSSQVLMESVTRLRSENEQAYRQAQTASRLHSSAPAEAFRLLRDDVIPAAAQLADGMAKLGELIRQNIKEDQRIVVVDAQGVLLGLVVDHVNEVLNISRGLIDAPPQVGENRALELSGIAKLNNGSRLIMLLDSDKLFLDQNLQAWQTAAGSGISRERQMGAARSSSQQGGTHGISAEQQLVTFRLGEEEYGIPISQIQEIDRYSQITRVPRAPSYVDGVTNLRGEVIPVIDTRKRFGMPVKAADDHTRIIIVELAGTKTGLLVDSVSQVLNIGTQDVAPPPAAIESGIDNEFISGIGKVNDGKRMIVLLNVEKILTRAEAKDLARVAAQP